jgi:hypothetical protein
MNEFYKNKQLEEQKGMNDKSGMVDRARRPALYTAGLYMPILMAEGCPKHQSGGCRLNERNGRSDPNGAGMVD